GAGEDEAAAHISFLSAPPGVALAESLTLGDLSAAVLSCENALGKTGAPCHTRRCATRWGHLRPCRPSRASRLRCHDRGRAISRHLAHPEPGATDEHRVGKPHLRHASGSGPLAPVPWGEL